MAQRKLNKQQQTRVRAQQDRTRNKQTTSDDSTEHQQLDGIIIQHHGKQAIVENETGELIKCKIRQNLGTIVCGDQVIYQSKKDDQEGVILAIKERKNVLVRPDFRRKPKAFAANIDQIIIVAAPEPELSEHLLDRYLVVLESIGLRGIIVVNKTDLLSDTQLSEIQKQLKAYKDLGYTMTFTSTKTSHGLESLKGILKGKSNILVGQSGVGKSSLINQLLPDLDLRTNELSQANHGKHTTSSSTLYHLPFSGDIIDSPGIRDFSVWHISEQQITDGFTEFKPYLGQCRFHNCRHINEPDCAIKLAADKGEISERRLKSYQNMLMEIEQG